MDKRSAEKIAISDKKGSKIIKSYRGVIGGEEVFAFVVSSGGYDNEFVTVFSDGTTNSIDPMMAISIVKSLTEVE